MKDPTEINNDLFWELKLPNINYKVEHQINETSDSIILFENIENKSVVLNSNLYYIKNNSLYVQNRGIINRGIFNHKIIDLDQQVQKIEIDIYGANILIFQFISDNAEVYLKILEISISPDLFFNISYKRTKDIKLPFKNIDSLKIYKSLAITDAGYSKLFIEDLENWKCYFLDYSEFFSFYPQNIIENCISLPEQSITKIIQIDEYALIHFEKSLKTYIVNLLTIEKPKLIEGLNGKNLLGHINISLTLDSWYKIDDSTGTNYVITKCNHEIIVFQYEKDKMILKFIKNNRKKESHIMHEINYILSRDQFNALFYFDNVMQFLKPIRLWQLVKKPKIPNFRADLSED